MNSPQKIINLLTICRRAGKAVSGFDPSCEAMKNGTVYCIITASDLSAKSEKEIRFNADKYGVPVIGICISKNTLGSFLGKPTGIVAVCDKGFAERFIQLDAEFHKADANTD